MILKIEDVLRFGNIFSLKLNVSTIDEVMTLLGEYDEKNEDEYSIDYYYGNVCFSFEIDSKMLLKVEIKFEDDTKYEEVFLSDKLYFQQEMNLEKIFLFLNYNHIDFSCLKSEVDLDYLYIKTTNNIRITYYLPWSSLIDISLLNNTP